MPDGLTTRAELTPARTPTFAAVSVLATSSGAAGLVVPIPTFPSSRTKNFETSPESVTFRLDVADVAPAPLITSCDPGPVLLMPTAPVVVMVVKGNR